MRGPGDYGRADRGAGSARGGNFSPGTEAAHAAARTKGTHLAAYHAQIRGRRGVFKAVGATCHDLLIAYWQAVHDQVDYTDLGPDWAQRRLSPAHRTRKLVYQLE